MVRVIMNFLTTIQMAIASVMVLLHCVPDIKLIEQSTRSAFDVIISHENDNSSMKNIFIMVSVFLFMYENIKIHVRLDIPINLRACTTPCIIFKLSCVRTLYLICTDTVHEPIYVHT